VVRAWFSGSPARSSWFFFSVPVFGGRPGFGVGVGFFCSFFVGRDSACVLLGVGSCVLRQTHEFFI